MTGASQGFHKASARRVKAPGRGRHSLQGYTLLEICLVLVIIAVVIGLAIPNITSLMTDERMRGTARGFSELATTARRLSVSEGRAYVIEFDERCCVLRPIEKGARGYSAQEEASEQVFKLPANITWQVERWNSGEYRRPKGERWVFGTSGLSEPVRVKFRGGGESWFVVSFSPLTVAMREEAYHFE